MMITSLDTMALKDKPVYMISVVAQMLDVHPQTLRLYEREGLIQPSRTEGNTRLYSQEDVQRVEKVLNLTRDLGVNLAGVDIILRLQERLESMEQEKNANLANFIQFVEKFFSERSPMQRESFLDAVQQAVQKGLLDSNSGKGQDNSRG